MVSSPSVAKLGPLLGSYKVLSRLYSHLEHPLASSLRLLEEFLSLQLSDWETWLLTMDWESSSGARGHLHFPTTWSISNAVHVVSVGLFEVSTGISPSGLLRWNLTENVIKGVTSHHLYLIMKLNQVSDIPYPMGQRRVAGPSAPRERGLNKDENHRWPH